MLPAAKRARQHHAWQQCSRLLGSWATVDPKGMSGSSPAQCYNLGKGLICRHRLCVSMHAVLPLMHASVVPTKIRNALGADFICSLHTTFSPEVPAPHAAVNGKWHLPANSKTIPDPYNGEAFVKVPDPQVRFVFSTMSSVGFCHFGLSLAGA